MCNAAAPGAMIRNPEWYRPLPAVQKSIGNAPSEAYRSKKGQAVEIPKRAFPGTPPLYVGEINKLNVKPRTRQIRRRRSSDRQYKVQLTELEHFRLFRPPSVGKSLALSLNVASTNLSFRQAWSSNTLRFYQTAWAWQEHRLWLSASWFLLPQPWQTKAGQSAASNDGYHRARQHRQDIPRAV